MIRLPFISKKKSKEEIEIIRFIVLTFGYRPKNIKIFIKALTHKSSAISEQEDSNERLEFLGDAVLDAIVAEYLYEKFPNEQEGYLTKLKSKMVSRTTLAEIAHEMNIREVMFFNNNRSINISTIEGNALEALIGAVYLDGGFEAIKKIIYHQIFRKFVDVNRIIDEEMDFKSKLFIWCQKRKLTLDFEVLEETNNKGNWHYVVMATINERNYGKGSGSSKKKAEQSASKETLELLGEI